MEKNIQKNILLMVLGQITKTVYCKTVFYPKMAFFLNGAEGALGASGQVLEIDTHEIDTLEIDTHEIDRPEIDTH